MEITLFAMAMPLMLMVCIIIGPISVKVLLSHKLQLESTSGSRQNYKYHVNDRYMKCFHEKIISEIVMLVKEFQSIIMLLHNNAIGLFYITNRQKDKKFQRQH